MKRRRYRFLVKKRNAASNPYMVYTLLALHFYRTCSIRCKTSTWKLLNLLTPLVTFYNIASSIKTWAVCVYREGWVKDMYNEWAPPSICHDGFLLCSTFTYIPFSQHHHTKFPFILQREKRSKKSLFFALISFHLLISFLFRLPLSNLFWRGEKTKKKLWISVSIRNGHAGWVVSECSYFTPTAVMWTELIHLLPTDHITLCYMASHSLHGTQTNKEFHYLLLLLRA